MKNWYIYTGVIRGNITEYLNLRHYSYEFLTPSMLKIFTRWNKIVWNRDLSIVTHEKKGMLKDRKEDGLIKGENKIETDHWAWSVKLKILNTFFPL